MTGVKIEICADQRGVSIGRGISVRRDQTDAGLVEDVNRNSRDTEFLALQRARFIHAHREKTKIHGALVPRGAYSGDQTDLLAFWADADAPGVEGKR